MLSFIPNDQVYWELMTPIREINGIRYWPCRKEGLYTGSVGSNVISSYNRITADQPAANPLCMIWQLIRRPGSLRITICTLNQGNLILLIEFVAIS